MARLPELVRTLLALATTPRLASGADGVLAAGKTLVRYLSAHTGVPALIVAALMLSLGYRVLKRSARFFAEVGVVALALFTAWQLGWICW